VLLLPLCVYVCVCVCLCVCVALFMPAYVVWLTHICHAALCCINFQWHAPAAPLCPTAPLLHSSTLFLYHSLLAAPSVVRGPFVLSAKVFYFAAFLFNIMRQFNSSVAELQIKGGKNFKSACNTHKHTHTHTNQVKSFSYNWSHM